MRLGDIFPDYEQWERGWKREGNRVQMIHHTRLANNRALEQFVRDTCFQDVFEDVFLSNALWEEGWQRYGDESHKKLLLQIAHDRQEAEKQRIVEQRIARTREQRIARAREAQRLQLDPEDLEGFRSLLKVLKFKNLT